MNAIRSGIKLQNVKVGWFKTYENCVTGSDLVNWMVKSLGYKADEAGDTFEKLIEKGVLYNVEGHTTFENSDKALYKFQADRTDIAANMVWPWTQEYHKPMQVSTDLLTKILAVYRSLLHESEEGKRTPEHDNAALVYIAYDELAKQAEFSRYVSAAAELQGVNLSVLGKREKNMFFLNIYQVALTVSLSIVHVHPLPVAVPRPIQGQGPHRQAHFGRVGQRKVTPAKVKRK